MGTKHEVTIRRNQIITNFVEMKWKKPEEREVAWQMFHFLCVVFPDFEKAFRGQIIGHSEWED